MPTKHVAFSVAILVLSSCAQPPKVEEARYLEKGRRELQRKNYAVAIIQFKNAVKLQPADAEPYYQLGSAYLAVQDFDTAALNFRRAAELNPGHTEAQLKLAELMSTSSDREVLEEAKKRSQDVLTRHPANVDALNILAAVELRLGQPQSAEAHLQQALRQSPGNLRSSAELAQARLARKDVAGAEDAFKVAAAWAPKSAEPKFFLGEFYLGLGKTAEAEQAFRQALQIDPKHGPALLALGGIQVRTGQTAQAEQTFRQVSKLPEKQYRPVHALYLFQSGKRDQALAELERLAKDDPEDRNLRTELVRTYLALNRISDAENVLTAALNRNALDTDALLQRSQIYLGSGKYAQAQADLNQVLHFRYESAEAHYLLAKVPQKNGETAIRQQELGEALRLNPQFVAARVELAHTLTLNRGAQSALQLLDEAPKEEQDVPPIILERNLALLALNRLEEARQGVDRILRTIRLPEALVQDASLKLVQKDYVGARASAEEVLSQNPDDSRALNLLVQSYAAQKQMPAGLQRTREFAAAHPKSFRVQQFLGRLLLANGDQEGARKAFAAAKATNPELVAADLALASIDASEGKRDQARQTISAVVSTHPDSVPGHMLWGNLELKDRKSAGAIEQFRKVVALDDSNAEALNDLAYLLADSKQPDEALRFAQRAKELAPDSPIVDDTLGWTYFQKGLYPLAVTYLERANRNGDNALHGYHLAMAYLKAGKPSEGRRVLAAALKMDPNLPEAQTARQLLGN